MVATLDAVPFTKDPGAIINRGTNPQTRPPRREYPRPSTGTHPAARFFDLSDPSSWGVLYKSPAVEEKQPEKKFSRPPFYQIGERVTLYLARNPRYAFDVVLVVVTGEESSPTRIPRRCNCGRYQGNCPFRP